MEATTVLFIKPSITRGIARNIDLFGLLNEFNISRNGAEADRLALASDIYAVGQDLKTAIEIVDEELKAELVD